MAKLYVFGIGGTGSRVLKSLTFLLASGVEMGQFDTIVPIIIDPDQSAGDLTYTVELMKRYNTIRKHLDFTNSPNKFFKTEIKETISNFRFPLNANTQNKKFKDFMSVSLMDDKNQALMKLLFSDANLESDMVVGFKGNPNIGSVVLDQISTSPEFVQFCNDFQGGDRIFIISSIFGGTGASGFPLLAKIFKKGQTLADGRQMPNNNLLNNAMLGAVTVLPYFNLQQDTDSAIDSGTFISKTKAALSYYVNGVNENVNSLYYIGDGEKQKTYNNCEGGENQKNQSHFVELASALAIVDFANDKTLDENSCNKKEFGIKEIRSNESIVLSDLGDVTKGRVAKQLIQMMLFERHVTKEFDTQRKSQTWAKDPGFDDTFASSNFIKEIKKILSEDYVKWLNEMVGNDVSFAPFNLSDSCELLDRVNGFKEKTSFLGKINIAAKKHKAFFEDKLNTEGKGKTSPNGMKENLMMELYYNATLKTVNEKFPNI